MPIFYLAASEALATEWQDPGIIFLKLSAVAFLVLLNGFFVASEFAIVKVRTSQLDTLIEEGHPKAKFARHVASHLDAYLSATQLGITLASLGLGWLGEPFLAEIIEPAFFKFGVTSPAVIHSFSFGIAFAIITFGHIVLGELAPKSLAIRKPVPTTLWVARLLGMFYAVFKPAIGLLNGAGGLVLKYVFRLEPATETEMAHSEEELRVILAESHKAEEVSSLEKEILTNVLDLRHMTARDIMTPRRSVVFLNEEDTMEENLETAKKSRHTRFPLCRGHLDEALGLIHIKDLLTLRDNPGADLNTIKRELLTVPEMMTLPALLTRFLSKHAHLALAMDEYGGAVGIVTLDNVMEQMVGQIQDEFDTATPDYQRLNEREFVVVGGLSLHELRSLTGLDLRHPDVSTVGGYITATLGRLPNPGERVQLEEYSVVVTQMDKHKVGQLRFTQNPE